MLLEAMSDTVSSPDSTGSSSFNPYTAGSPDDQPANLQNTRIPTGESGSSDHSHRQSGLAQNGSDTQSTEADTVTLHNPSSYSPKLPGNLVNPEARIPQKRKRSLNALGWTTKPGASSPEDGCLYNDSDYIDVDPDTQNQPYLPDRKKRAKSDRVKKASTLSLDG